MGTRSTDQLRRIAEADDLHISPFREDGVTYGTPMWIWSVAVGDNLYVRAYYGQNSRWYQAAVREKAERITAAGMTKEVTFEPVEGAINERIDDASVRSTVGARISARWSATARGPRQSRSHLGRAMPDHDWNETTRMGRILLVLWLVMPLDHAVCGADNTTTKGTDSMKIRYGKGLLTVQHSNAQTNQTKFHETFTLSCSLRVFPFPC